MVRRLLSLLRFHNLDHIPEILSLATVGIAIQTAMPKILVG
jgi:hypothetical protein